MKEDTNKMKILVATGSGFCFGVKRAMDLAYKYTEKNSSKGVYSLREIIHNPQEVKRLEAAGARHVDKVSSVKKGGCAIISTHGVTAAEEKALRERASDVLDTTCPYVKKIHLIAGRLASEGYNLVIAGDAEHFEVKGILGHAVKVRAVVIGGIDEISDAVLSAKTGIVAQTTFNVEKYEEIVCEITKRVFGMKNSEVRAYNTICDATQKRQEATLAIAEKVDIMIVVGGKNSANTRRLYELSRAKLKKVYHIESADEIKKAWFKDVKTAGISAGASTPQRVIDEVVNKIKGIGEPDE